jgi:hypothetical protein
VHKIKLQPNSLDEEKRKKKRGLGRKKEETTLAVERKKEETVTHGLPDQPPRLGHANGSGWVTFSSAMSCL